MKTFNAFIEEKKNESNLHSLANHISENKIDVEKYLYEYFEEYHPEFIQEGLWDRITQSNLGQAVKGAYQGYQTSKASNIKGNWNSALRYLKSLEGIANQWANDAQVGEQASKLKNALNSMAKTMHQIQPEIKHIDQMVKARAFATNNQAFDKINVPDQNQNVPPKMAQPKQQTPSTPKQPASNAWLAEV
jgi:hypothetical protein